MSMKEAYEKKLQAQLDEWSAEIDRLRAKAAGVQADKEIEYNKQIEKLQSEQENARKKLTQLKNASEDAWEDMKAGVESAWDSLDSAVKSAMSRFHK